jgi:bacterioferritin-associated ferredoxin
MYICICKAVTESRIRSCVAAGATSLRDLRERTALGTGCGKCVPQAYQYLRETLDREHSPAAHHEIATRTG